ncbi:MAG: DUF445 family protein [Treponema sp.]|nr:DUF445 family protein [Treponema sp.]
MRNILIFLVPPAAGAIIGFVTNVVAIRMLFRPLKEIRVFGIRLPFTPGILPRQRSRLAQSIGAMVERELLTPEILRQRLLRGDVREKIKESLSSITENLINRTPSEILEGNERFLAEKIPDILDKLYPALSAGILNFLRRNDIRRELDARGRVFLKNIFLKLNTFQRFFISAAQYDLTLEQKMPEIIDELTVNAENLLQDNKVKNTLTSAASVSINRMIFGQDNKIGLLLNINENNKAEIDNFLFQKVITAADEQIESLLASINVKTLVSERIDSLDMLRVERIILDVMSDQFKWIDIFGGILGFLIGMFQSVFNWLVR